MFDDIVIKLFCGIDLPKYKFDVKKRNDVRSQYEINEGKLVGYVGRLQLPKIQYLLKK